MKLKLRAWDKTNKCWIEEFGITNKGEYLCWDNGYVVIPNGHRQKNIEIMQYTGLTDKNGKEIYCGDIVKKNGGGIAEMRFGSYDWGNTIGFYLDDIYCQTMSMAWHWEIIGNIYQDSHLLKEAK